MSDSALGLVLGFVTLALVIGFTLGWRARRERGTTTATANAAGPPTRSPGVGPPVMQPSVSSPSAGPIGSRAFVTPAVASTGAASGTAGLLKRAQSWGYQLQNLDLNRAAASPFDLLVIDYATDGDQASALKPAEVARLQKKSDGTRRLVIAYLSIGEAESYRSYWKKDWKRQRPAWLLGENPEWEENYAVCFWDPGWQANLCGSPDAYLDRILAQGFDGIYLDKCDVGEDLKRREKQAARQRLYRAMQALRDHAINIPEDVAIVGFDDIPAASLTHPPLTTIQQNYKLAGELLVDGVLKQIRNEQVPTALLPAKLIVRQSCGARALSVLSMVA